MQSEVKPVATSLLGEPSAEASFHFLLRKGPVQAGIFEPSTHFIENVEMILNVLKRAIVRQLIRELLNVSFRSAHNCWG